MCARNMAIGVIILTVVHLDDWSHHSNLFSNEFGHVLGAELHDDHFYDWNPDGKFIMWPAISRDSYVWSNAARKQIMEHDLGCLENINMTGNKPLDEMKSRHLYELLSPVLSHRNLRKLTLN